VNSTDLAELVALDAAGALDDAEQRALRERLARATPEEREASARLYDAALPGIRVKVLSLDRERDLAVMLLRVEPGSTYPAHRHSTAEECYVISGEITIHGQRLTAGDFHHAEPHTDHDVIISDRGAEVLLVASPRDYLS
jgi:quercetin dioxygenase-like cupin family protein